MSRDRAPRLGDEMFACPECGSDAVEAMSDPDYNVVPPETVCRDCGYAGPDDDFRWTLGVEGE